MKIKISGLLLIFHLFSALDDHEILYSNFKVQQRMIIPNVSDIKILKTQFEYSLFYFNSSHCQVCQKFKQDFIKVAATLSQKKHDLPVSFVNCGERSMKDFCSYKEKIRKYPTIRLYHHDKFVEYKGKLTSYDLVVWIRDRTVSSMIKIDKNDNDRIERLLKKEEIVFLMENSDQNEQKKKVFSMVSTFFDMVHYFYTEKKEVYEKAKELCGNMDNYEKQEDKGLLLLHPDHHNCYFYNGYLDHKKIISFLKEKEKASLRAFDNQSIKMHHYHKLPIVILLIDKREGEVWENYKEIVSRFHDFYFFTYIDNDIYDGIYPDFTFNHKEPTYSIKNKELVHSLMIDLGVDQKQFPSIFVYNKLESLSIKYKFFGNLNIKQISKFLNDVYHKKVQRFKKFQPLDNLQDGGIEKLSSLNFNQTKKTNCVILIEGSKELCSHCSEILQEFEKSSKNIKNGNLKFYRFNSQLNELDDWNFEQIPEILIFNEKGDIKGYTGIMKEPLITQAIQNYLIQNDEL